MPSRQPPPAPLLPEFPTSQPPPLQHHNHHHHSHHHFLISLLAITAATSALILVLLILYRKKLSRKRTAPSDLKPPHKFSFLDLRRATSSFSASNRLGQGGFGSVYKATLSSGQNVAVKLMDSETESVITGFEEGMGMPDQSPESFARVTDVDEMTSPEMVVMASPSEGLDKTSVSEGYFDKLSVDSGKELVGSRRNCGKKNGGSGRDWWWKQDNGVCGGGGDVVVKDYVMEWIGNEIKKERPNSDWIASSSSKVENGSGSSSKMENNKKHKKRLEWWNSLDEEKVKKKEKARKPREWWKEEFCEELSKKKKKRELKCSNGDDNWWNRDDDLTMPERKKRKSRGSRSSIDWWLDGLSGELRSGRRNSQDWASGDIPKSGGVSSTPSMRGTVCYIAPEYGGGGQLSEKCDVYSYGVLVLVLISGRRPLQVTASPMSEFERANLISWARQLARNGKLLDLVDSSIHSVDREQALLCITIALLCLQRSPSKRPTMKEIVGMFSGESEPPTLPLDFSPSPPSGFPFKSRKKARLGIGSWYYLQELALTGNRYPESSVMDKLKLCLSNSRGELQMKNANQFNIVINKGGTGLVKSISKFIQHGQEG
ncbi:Protein kinase domain [Dillenia turbinata]|uniref:Protein kinase domain n=1 Tax=Dillenia turbinata TaxID=194707 RepID=A0AAN8V093_9MAGN